MSFIKSLKSENSSVTGPKRISIAALIVVAILLVVGGRVAESQSRKAGVAAAERSDERRNAQAAAPVAVPEKDAKTAQVEIARLERQLAESYLDRGLRLCDEGEAARGSLWMARALTVLSSRKADGQSTEFRERNGALDPEHAIRANLGAWQSSISRLRLVLPHRAPVTHLAISPDGRTLLTSSFDKTAWLWDTTTGKPIGAPLEHKGTVDAIAFSPDGKTVLTGSDDKTARLWDASMGKPIGAAFQHWDAVYAVAFSPDGKTVLTGSRDNTARLWNAATGKPIGAPLRHPGDVRHVAYSPNGKTVVTASVDRTPRLWDAATGKPIGPLVGHDDSVNVLVYSQSGERILTGSRDKTARMWDAATGTQVGLTLEHQGEVEAVAFSPDGQTVLTGSADKTARLWYSAMGQPVDAPLPHEGPVHAVAYSPDGKTIVTGTYKQVRLWDVSTGKPIGAPLECPEVNEVVFSPDGNTVLTGGGTSSRRIDRDVEHGEARLWEVASGKAVGARLGPDGDDKGASLVGYSPDGKTVLTRGLGDDDSKVVRLWDAATGQPIGAPLHHQDVAYAWEFSPDSKTVLTGSWDKTARLWNAATGKPISAPLQHDGPVRDVAYSPDGKTVLTGGDDKTARLWDATTGDRIGTPLQHQGSVYQVAYSPDGKALLTCGEKGARLWDAASRKPIGAPLRGVAHLVGFSPDGKTLLTGNLDQTGQVWDVATAKPVGAPLRHLDCINHIAYSPDGKKVLTGSQDGTARLWDAATGKPITAPLQHERAVHAIAYSPDGKTVLTGSTDNTARLWDAATGKPIGAPLQHQDCVNAVAYTPDGKTVLTGCDDKTVRLWDAATEKPIGLPLQQQGRVNDVRCGPDGKTVVAGSTDTAARLWQLPATVQGEPDRINLSIELATGLRIVEGGAYQRLSTEEWLDGKRRLDSPGPLPPPDPSVLAPRTPDVTYMPDSGDLTLTPATIPESDSAPHERVIPGGQGDRVVMTKSDEEGRGGKVARITADGGTKWIRPLNGYVGGVRPPHIAADADRAYVTHFLNHKAGVTALDAGTGQVLWHSPGPGDHLLLSGDLLLAVDCTVGVDGEGGGRFLIARRGVSGKEVFRVALPTGQFDAEIEGAADLFLLHAWGGRGPSFLIDRTGRVRHRIDREVVAVTATGSDRLVLTSQDVIRLGADGPPRWSVPFAYDQLAAGGALVPLAGGDVVAYLYDWIADSGVQILRFDPANGRKKWVTRCPPLGVDHSEYSHRAVVEVDGSRLKVTSVGSQGTFVEILDPQTGRSLARRIIKRCQ